MPLGYERVNIKASQPNSLIVFIKPLKGPNEAVAKDFLERIAAQCYPVMKKNGLTVISLEEYEPNREFLGRNFNAGEVIQLVLKSRQSGRWLPFDFVQMVMMHELAHCKQMNHSRSFWTVRNAYAEEMRTLMSRGYTGEGLWGRGKTLETGKFTTNMVLPEEPIPEHLCGGTYRSRSAKRKGKDLLSHRERKERRILKKFGPNGVALGADSETKARLENGKSKSSKPRVASSARGRELRAAAALARFDQQKAEPSLSTGKAKDLAKVESDTDSSETESEFEDNGLADAIDINGKILTDNRGEAMVKVCDDEKPDEQETQQELRELQTSIRRFFRLPGGEKKRELEPLSPVKPGTSKDRPPGSPTANSQGPVKRSKVDSLPGKSTTTYRQLPIDISSRPVSTKDSVPAQMESGTLSLLCPICSFSNEVTSVVCVVCSHVLDRGSVPDSWRCKGTSCRDSSFVNPGYCGVCNICGTKRS